MGVLATRYTSVSVHVEFRGSPAGGPAVSLDHTEFRYAGKFQMTTTGKALLIDSNSCIAITAFSTDRSCDNRIWLRYVSVHDDYQARGVGPRFLRTTTTTLLDQVKSIRIAVNNPFAYVAAYKAGFVYTGEQTGIAELLLDHPGIRTTESYLAGLEVFRDADHLSSVEQSYLEEKHAGAPPPVDNRQFPIRDSDTSISSSTQ